MHPPGFDCDARRPAISVLMAVYGNDNPAYFQGALASIYGQTLLPDELVLVVDGPVPDIIETVIREYCSRPEIRFHVVRNAVNLGLPRSLQAGLAAISSPYVARMDADDICAPKRLEVQLACALESGCDILYSSSQEFNDDVRKVVSINVAPEPSRLGFLLNFRNPVVHPSLFARTSRLRSIGGYRDLRGFEDYDLLLRLLRGGAQFASVAEPLVYFRVSRDHRLRRTGWNYFALGIRHKLRWIREGLVNPVLCTLSICPFAVFTLAPVSLKGLVYRLLRKMPRPVVEERR